MGLYSKSHPYRRKGGHAARCACCTKSTLAGSTGWVEIHVEGEAASYRSGCNHTAIGQVTAMMSEVIRACSNLEPEQVPLAHRACAEAAAAAHAVCQRLRGQEPASQLQPMPRLSSTPTQAHAQPGPAHAPCPHHLPDQPPSHPSQSQLQGSSQHHPALSAPLHLPGLSILTRPATNPVTSPAKEQQPIIHTTEEQDEQTMPPSMPKQLQDRATASIEIMSEHWHAQQIGILVACAYFKNKEGAYKEHTVYVMPDGQEQSAAITQAAVNQVVCYLLAEHDMDMRQLYMWSDGCAGQFKGAPAMRQHWGMAQRFSMPKRDDKHWDDECLTLLCSFAPDSVKQLCTLGKKLSVKMLNEYCKAVGLYVPANTLRADLRYMRTSAMAPDLITQRPCFAWLWKDATLADAKLRLWSAPWHTTLDVHRVVLAANSEYFKARVLRWPGSESQDTEVVRERKLVHLPTSLPCWDETFDSPAECDVAGLVVRCMYEGRLVDEQQDALTLARVRTRHALTHITQHRMCRVAERWAFSSLTRCCLQQLSALPAPQLLVTHLLLVLETLPDLSGLQPEHNKWLDRVHSLAAGLAPGPSPLPLLLHLYGDVHAVITSAQLRDYFLQLPVTAVLRWAASDELTVDSENSVVELLSLWMAGPRACRPPASLPASLPACAAYAQGRLPTLAWFQIPGAATAKVAAAASCATDMTGVLNKDKEPAAWAASPRTQLDPAELLRRTTIRWDVPRQRLASLIASKDLTAKIASEPVYTAGAGWRVYVDLNKGKDKKDFTLGCWGQVVAYAECKQHSLGAKLPLCTPIRYTITKSTELESMEDWTEVSVSDGYGRASFLGKGINNVADVEPFLKGGCLQITAAFQVQHKPPNYFSCLINNLRFD
ncbi:hypothetical protein QJQ45_029900 [Haematococcus lacustris]|nr:hypothetical protein QJQ45_029900 [Haematococcus lacustris]